MVACLSEAEPESEGGQNRGLGIYFSASELPLPLHYCLQNSISFYYLVEAVPIRASYLRSDGDLALIYLMLYVLK
jgi:hypothetical protein